MREGFHALSEPKYICSHANLSILSVKMELFFHAPQPKYSNPEDAFTPPILAKASNISNSVSYQLLNTATANLPLPAFLCLVLKEIVDRLLGQPLTKLTIHQG